MAQEGNDHRRHYALVVGIGIALLSGRLSLWDGITFLVVLLTVVGGCALFFWNSTVGHYQALPMATWGDNSVSKDVGTWTMGSRRDDSR